jgi:hypothetical protein
MKELNASILMSALKEQLTATNNASTMMEVLSVSACKAFWKIPIPRSA